MEAGTIPDLRGRMTRGKRLMPDVEARAFLREKKIANIGTVDRNGWPYVVPLTYIYEGEEELYFHTGGHQGHFLTNLEQNPTACLEVSEIGPLQKGNVLRATPHCIHQRGCIWDSKGHPSRS